MPEAADATAVRDLLLRWVRRDGDAGGRDWLDTALRKTAAGDERAALLAFGMAPRKTGRRALDLTDEDRHAADAARTGWRPAGWTVDQAARTLLVLHVPDAERSRLLDRLCRTAAVQEAVALHAALPVLPDPESHVARAAEGIRSNIAPVFCAVAHRNPYPADRLAEPAWNQMVLKALFIGVALDPVVGLDRRANPRLAAMLCEYAHERWAAGRPVAGELWRCVGPFADGVMLDDLERAIRAGESAAADSLRGRADAHAEPVAGLLRLADGAG